jgi:hypothetical protein
MACRTVCDNPCCAPCAKRAACDGSCLGYDCLDDEKKKREMRKRFFDGYPKDI